MIEFKIPGMKCGGCVARVNAALKTVDPHCEIQIDLEKRAVSLETDERTQTEAFAEALRQAGYPSS